MILPKLVKMPASVLCESSLNAINNSLSKIIFTDDAKIVFVSQFDKVTFKKIAVDSLKQTLQSESEVAIKMFHENEMIINSDKFQAVLLDKRKLNNTNVKFDFGSDEIQAVSSVDILGITIDDKPNFHLNIDKICLNCK